MINKNKQTIEKMKEESKTYSTYDWGYSFLQLKLKTTIETSILWCEDEIEFLNKWITVFEVIIMEEGTKIEMLQYLDERKEQLTTHLKWLKEAKEIKNEL